MNWTLLEIGLTINASRSFSYSFRACGGDADKVEDDVNLEQDADSDYDYSPP